MIYIYLILILLVNIPGRESWGLSSFGESLFSFFEGCNSGSINPDFDGLKIDFEDNLFGQHIIKNNLLAALKNHFNGSPKKPLVITMNGWTGSGKTYVTEMVINRIYKYGIKSKFVHFFTGKLHFPKSNAESIYEYRINLQSWLRGNITNCPESFFVFEEADKIPDGVIDGIKPFLDYHPAVDKIDFRKSIFVFISNRGGDLIMDKYLELWNKGLPRLDMNYREFEKLLRHDLHDSAGVFYESDIIEDHLISLYLPFLPMEKVHVEKCIEVEFKRKSFNPRPGDISYILNSLEYYKGILSLSGCKRVSDFVGLIVYGEGKPLSDEL